MFTSMRPIVAIGELLWDLLPSGPRAGGALFNFAFHCHQLGHPAAIVSAVGADDLGRALRREVRRLGLSDDFIQTDPAHPTGTVAVSVDGRGQPTYLIATEVAWDYIRWTQELHELAQSAQAVCFGTLAQRCQISRTTIGGFIANTPEDCLAVCDLNVRKPFISKDVVAESLRLADWLKLNHEEAEELRPTLESRPVSGTPTNEVWQKLFVSQLLSEGALFAITRGANGCLVGSVDDLVDLPGIPIAVADTVGAGDAFTAALLTQRLAGRALAQAARFANAYAAVVAGKVGGTPAITHGEVERLL